jgi:hypothetical protein
LLGFSGLSILTEVSRSFRRRFVGSTRVGRDSQSNDDALARERMSWTSPERHDLMSGVFKCQIDWVLVVTL